MSSTAGHNLSQGDLESEGDSEKNPANTGQGCYKNYDHYPHHRRNNTSTQVLQMKASYILNSFSNISISILQQNPVPEPDVQPSYSPVAQQGWSTESNREQDDEQLIDNEEGTPQQQEPFMRASRAVSTSGTFLTRFFTFQCPLSVLVVT